MKTRVMVVDDDPSILELLKVLLANEGYDVLTFDTGAAALNAARRSPPDAAIVDLMMPGMTGKELIRGLRRYAATREVPVVVCSAYYGDLRCCVRDLAGDANLGYLRKPFHIDDMVLTVQRMAARNARSVPASGAASKLGPVAGGTAAKLEPAAAGALTNGGRLSRHRTS